MSKEHACKNSRECFYRNEELETLKNMRVPVEGQKTISDWATSTFGYPKSAKISIDRMLEEAKELKELSELNDFGFEEAADECADIYITLCQAMNVMGFDLHACVDHKMQINRARKWKLNGDGTAQHIKE